MVKEISYIETSDSGTLYYAKEVNGENIIVSKFDFSNYLIFENQSFVFENPIGNKKSLMLDTNQILYVVIKGKNSFFGLGCESLEINKESLINSISSNFNFPFDFSFIR